MQVDAAVSSVRFHKMRVQWKGTSGGLIHDSKVKEIEN